MTLDSYNVKGAAVFNLVFSLKILTTFNARKRTIVTKCVSLLHLDGDLKVFGRKKGT